MSLTKPQAILFDLDGTLLDTAPDLGAALNKVLAAEERPLVTAEEYTPLASHGSAGLLKHAYGIDEFEQRKHELRTAFLQAYADSIASGTALYPGVIDLLEALRTHSIAIAIVTNKPSKLTEQLLPYYPQLHAIDVVVCGDTLAVAKPHPEPLLHAAQQLGVSAEACWYIGDAERDIQAGRAAGMRTVLAAYGYIHSSEQPHLWQADHQIQTPLELLSLL